MRKNRSGNAIWLSMTFLLVFCLTFPAGAVEKPKDYPDRPVTIMVGFPRAEAATWGPASWRRR